MAVPTVSLDESNAADGMACARHACGHALELGRPMGRHRHHGLPFRFPRVSHEWFDAAFTQRMPHRTRRANPRSAQSDLDGTRKTLKKP